MRGRFVFPQVREIDENRRGEREYETRDRPALTSVRGGYTAACFSTASWAPGQP
jgi:hypothetical protein